ncbi:MAG: protein-disulfide reductase DsbD [Gammaproteobacteria bacterium]
MKIVNTGIIGRHTGLLWLRCWLLAGLLPGSAVHAEDILRPEEAFRYQISATPTEILVVWNIEPEHYLYRERMGVSSSTTGISLGDAIFLPGKIYADEFFGEMEIYRGRTQIRVPYTRQPGSPDTIELALQLQGCADIGLCYPPQNWNASVTLPAATAAPAPAKSRTLEQLLNNGGPTGLTDELTPLPVDEAFRPSLSATDPFTLELSWTIEPGYYLYRDSFSVASKTTDVAIGSLRLPPGQIEQDEYFGETEVYFESVTVTIPVTRANRNAMLAELSIDYQGCKKDSICYPPETLMLAVDLPAASSADQPRTITPKPQSEQSRLASLIAEGNLLLVMAAFLGAGLLLAFTPCVLPMVPILSGIIAGQGKDVTTLKAFSLSLTYVLGMALTYTIAGALFASAGQQVQAVLQKPWIIISVAGLFVALALAMFGAYELQMPSAIQTRINAFSNRQRSGSYLGTALMGALSALVVTTCVAPPLVAALTVIAESGDVMRGALALFALSIGMGIPLLVIGTSAGKLLPKAGPWMDHVKAFFGFMMLALAIWMLDRLWPGPFITGLIGALAIGAGVYMGAWQRLTAEAGNGAKAAKAAGLIVLLYGLIVVTGALAGATNPLRPLAPFSGEAAQHEGLEFKRIKTVADLNAAVQQARENKQPVMLDFYADWCVSCKEMEYFSFSDSGVKEALAGFVLLQADVTLNDAEDQALLKHFGIFGPPTIVFYDRSATEISDTRVVGYLPAEDFIEHINRTYQ